MSWNKEGQQKRWRRRRSQAWLTRRRVDGGRMQLSYLAG
jgi:hypothetical protein